MALQGLIPTQRWAYMSTCKMIGIVVVLASSISMSTLLLFGLINGWDSDPPSWWPLTGLVIGLLAGTRLFPNSK